MKITEKNELTQKENMVQIEREKRSSLSRIYRINLENDMEEVKILNSSIKGSCNIKGFSYQSIESLQNMSLSWFKN